MTWSKVLRKNLFCTAKLAIPLIVLAASSLLLIQHLATANFKTVLAKTAQDNLQSLQCGVELSLRQILSDLHMLASFRHTPLSSTASHAQCRKDFIHFMANKPQYHQLHYLDGSGCELLRINEGGSPETVDAERLARMPHQEAFLDTDGIWHDSVYVSRFAGDAPPTPASSAREPVLGFATAFFDREETLENILILECSGEDILSPFAATGDNEVVPLLLNGGGRLLGKPVSTDAHLSGGNAPAVPLFADEYSAEWSKMTNAPQGVFTTTNGIYAFATVNPGRVIDSITTAGTGQAAESWKVAAHVPAAVIDSFAHSTATGLTLFFIPLALLLTGGSYALVSLRDKSSRAEEVLLRQDSSNERFVPREFLRIMRKENLRDVELSQSVQKDMTVLFSDIRSYTRLSESLPPQEVFELLNNYFSRIDTAITARHGFIDKYIGDAVMALFTGTADEALRAAIAMRNRIDQFNMRQVEDGKPEIHTGFGLHFGEVSLGSVGTMRRMQPTVIGDTANIAARIESATKAFKTDIIISDTVYDRLEHPEVFRLRKIDTVRVKGKDHPVTLYEAYDADDSELAALKDATRQDFDEGIRLYVAGDFEAALASFTRCHEQCPEDPIPPIYIKRCHTMQRMNPGEAWTGISTV